MWFIQTKSEFELKMMHQPRGNGRYKVYSRRGKRPWISSLGAPRGGCLGPRFRVGLPGSKRRKDNTVSRTFSMS